MTMVFENLRVAAHTIKINIQSMPKKTCIMPNINFNYDWLIDEGANCITLTSIIFNGRKRLCHTISVGVYSSLLPLLPRPQALGNRTRIMWTVYMTYCVVASWTTWLSFRRWSESGRTKELHKANWPLYISIAKFRA